MNIKMDTGNGRILCFSLLTFFTLLTNGVVSIYVCEKPSDVVFVLDISNSIWRPDFDTQKNFVRSVINKFTIGEENMRVGAVAFADFPRLQFHLNRFFNKRDVKQAIGRMRQHGGVYTFTADALRYMRKRSFQYSNGMRKNSTKIGIVITDGRSYDTVQTGYEAEKARAEGIHLFAIGVGNKVDQHELDVIASHPTSDYSFMVENFNSLKQIQDLLAEKTCTVTDPPTTTTTTTTTTTPLPITTTTTTTTPPPTTTTVMPTTTPTTSTSSSAYPQIRFVTPSPEIPVLPLPGSDINDVDINPQEFKGLNPDIIFFPGVDEAPSDGDVIIGKKSEKDGLPNQIGWVNPDGPDNGVDGFVRPSIGIDNVHPDGGDVNIEVTHEHHGGDGNRNGSDTNHGTNHGHGTPANYGDGNGDHKGDDNYIGDGSNVIVGSPHGTGHDPIGIDGGTVDVHDPGNNNISSNIIDGPTNDNNRGDGGNDRENNNSKINQKSKKSSKNKTKGRRTSSHFGAKTLDYHFLPYKGKGCGPQQPTDIVFVVDSKSGSDAYQRYLWNFVRDVTSRLDMDEDMFRIQFVHECVSVPEMSLDAYNDKSSLMAELKHVIDAPRKTASLLRSMSGKITAIQDPFAVRRKVGIYVTDGHSMDPTDTAIAAREAKEQYGVDMYVVGVGGRINPTELKTMVSKVDSKHLYMMSHHMKLPKVARHLAKQMCIKYKSRRLKLRHHRR